MLTLKLLNFNSIKVRLERLEAAGLNPYLMNFNSIKVRLERAGSLVGGLFSSQFQFHKGAIRTHR